MAIFSKLTSRLVPFVRRSSLINIKRYSHGRNMQVEASHYQIRKTLDLIHFYASIGVLTSLPVILWFNLTQAPAELADIPEGYEPEYWEYEKHPIRRFLAKYVYSDPRITYEKHLTNIYLEREEEFMSHFQRRIENIMRKKHDSASWFYEPIDQAPSRIMLDDQFRWEEEAHIQAPPFGHFIEGPEPPPDFQGVKEGKTIFRIEK